MFEQRTTEFKRNNSLESLLTELNGLLSIAETDCIRQISAPKLPVVMVIGAPRSGTTLMMQWLAATGSFCYPTNLMSRFYAAPYIGSRLVQLLTDPDYAYRDELKELQSDLELYASDLGKTSGVSQPNEFWYFWRRFFPIKFPQPLGELKSSDLDIEGFARGIGAIEHVFGKPFASKGMLLQYDLDVLCKAFTCPVFIHTQRNTASNADSLLRAREKYYGNRAEWYSAQPPEFEQLVSLDPVSQVVGQISCTDSAIKRQCEQLGCHRIEVQYEKFCLDPGAVYNRISTLFKQAGCELPAYSGVDGFPEQNRELDADFRASVDRAITTVDSLNDVPATDSRKRDSSTD